MVALFKEKVLHGLFELGLALKGFNGAWETLSGLVVLLASKATLETWFIALAYQELLEDPNDKVVVFVINTFLDPHTSTKTFVALYILVHGLLNIFLAIQLYRKKHWAYPATIGIIAVMVFYQLYRIAMHHSVILTVFTVFDVFFMYLTWHEYKHYIAPQKFKTDESEIPLSEEN